MANSAQRPDGYFTVGVQDYSFRTLAIVSLGVLLAVVI